MRDQTASSGDWLVEIDSLEAADYQARARKKSFIRNGQRHVCDIALSEVLKFS